jgi:tetratricopeptide (TPR) repeat protein
LAEAVPNGRQHAVELAISLVKLGDFAGHPAFANAGDPASAQAAYEEALTRLDAPPLTTDHAAPVPRYRALVRERLGRMLQLAGNRPAALDTLRKALTLRVALAAQQGMSVEARRDVAIGHYLLADLLLEQGALDEATAHAAASLAIRDSLARADRDNVQLRRGLGLAHGQLARLASTAGRPNDARAELARARIAWASYLLGRDPSGTDRAELRALDSLARVITAAR